MASMRRVFSYGAALPADASGWSLMGRLLIWATRNAEADKAVEEPALRKEPLSPAERRERPVVLAR
jgi:hypothetical protein